MEEAASIKAVVLGKELTQLPEDLYIPPDALEVLLDSFSGPLDLLLYLIRKQNIDILNIPIHSITEQYLYYIQLMEYRNLELAADYLLMAALLAEIKSRMLLPLLPVSEEDAEEDPRAVLVRRLLVYEEMQQAAVWLDALPRQEREHFLMYLPLEAMSTVRADPAIEFSELLEAMKSVLEQEQHRTRHEISREHLSVRERMAQILAQLDGDVYVEFKTLFTLDEGRSGLVVSLLAVLELARQSLLCISQLQPFAPLYVKAA